MHGDYREILYPHANKDLEVVYNKNDEPKRVVTSDEEDDFASGVVVGVVVQELQLEFVVQLQLQLQFPFPLQLQLQLQLLLEFAFPVGTIPNAPNPPLN